LEDEAVRMAELSRTTGVPIPTVKYYLREGLLPPGASTGPNQAEYGSDHTRRLRLIRVLREVGELGIAQVRKVLEAIDAEEVSLHEVLGRAHHALGPTRGPAVVSDDLRQAKADVDSFIADLGWRVSAEAPARWTLAESLLALRRLSGAQGPEIFAPYAEVADRIAAAEVRSGPEDASRAETVEWMVIGTVVYEAALSALRRLAQEHHSALEFGRQVAGAGEPKRGGQAKK
jgi:DNA-binding transcriptional MerR regulator